MASRLSLVGISVSSSEHDEVTFHDIPELYYFEAEARNDQR